MSDYHRQVTEHETRRQEREQAAEAALVARRVARKKQQVEQQQARQNRRQSRETLIASLQHLSAVERLGHVIADTTRPVTFYPAEWAALDSATIAALPASLRLDTIQRLADRRTGSWEETL